MTRTPTAARALAALLAAFAALAAPRGAAAQGPAPAAAEELRVRIDARFVDPATGLEAEWGATGQILLPPGPAGPSLAPWRGARTVATSSSRQSVTVPPGGRATIRVGREIPFAGWFLRLGRRRGVLEEGTEWREVESTLEVEPLPLAADGTVRLIVYPQFGYLQGRTRRAAVFPDLRLELALADGVEARFAPAPAQAGFFERFLAGYDLLRRVRAFDLVLRATVLRTPVP